MSGSNEKRKKPAPIPNDDSRLEGLQPDRLYLLKAARQIIGIKESAYRTLKRIGGLSPMKAAGNLYVTGKQIIDAIQRVDAEKQST